VDVPRLFRDARVLEAGHPGGVERLREVADAGFGLAGRTWRDATPNEIRGRFAQETSRRAVRVPVDRPGWRVARVLRDAGEAKRRAVGDDVMAGGLRCHDRIVRRRRVEVLRGEHATLSQLALVPSAALDPR